MKIGRPIIRALHSNSKESRVEKEKKAYKDQMWSKVNTWLHDLDKKTIYAKVTGEDTKDIDRV
jgi:hypothetical protein